MDYPQPVFTVHAVKPAAEIYASHGSTTLHDTVEEPQTMWWDRDRIESTVNRQFVLSQLRPNEQALVDQPLRFGAGLTDDTYLDWIEERAKRIFLILVDLNVPDQIFGVIDDSWDDDDLPLPLNQIERLKLTYQRDERLEKKFFIRQFSYLLRTIDRGEHVVYADDEVVPLDVVERRPLTSLGQNVVDKISLPNKSDCLFVRRRIPLGFAPGRMPHEDFLAGLEAMKKIEHRHLTSLWGSYIHGSNGYVILSPVNDGNLKSVLNVMPASIKILNKQDRRLMLLNWLHCLADALAFLHSRGFSHGKIAPSNILLDDDNTPFLSDCSVFEAFDIKRADDKELYDYASPEKWGLQMKSSQPSPPTSRLEGRVSFRRPGTAPQTTAPPVQPPTAAYVDPQKADVFSLGCVMLEVLTLFLKRASRSFASHRAAKNKSPGRGGSVPDSSFHRNLPQVESWMDLLAKDASKKEDRIFRGISHLISLVSRMLLPAPDARPAAQFVADRLRTIMLDICHIDAIRLHCVSHRLGNDGFDFGLGNLRLGESIGGQSKTDPSSPLSPGIGMAFSSSNSSAGPDTFSVNTKRSNGSKTSGSKTGSSGGNGKKGKSKKAWQAPVYAGPAVVVVARGYCITHDMVMNSVWDLMLSDMDRTGGEHALVRKDTQDRTGIYFFFRYAHVIVVIYAVCSAASAASAAHSCGGMLNGDRQTGRRAQLSNITAAKTVADIIRSCLGPKAMLKMLLDPMGGIVLTNDGHAILREIEVSHPAAKSMIELSRTQDEEVGDGTTTVIILAGEILAQAVPQLERNIHPVVIISAFKQALKDALEIIEEISLPVDIDDDKAMYDLIQASIGTKFVSRWSELMCSLALRAVRTVTHEVGSGKMEVDIKRYARVEKIPGGEIEDSRVLDGVMLNKDITHPKMRRRIENPRIVLLDCPLEYKKGESQTNIEISKEEDWNRILQIEEEQVKAMCDAILAVKPDLVITEKGVSDLAQHYLLKGNITALRRVRKTDNNRIARATGATIVNRVEDLQDSDVGTKCGLFEISKIGDEYFTFLTKCKAPKACTILLRGPSKDILNEIDRNLADAMSVARNVMFHPRLSPGGGATEMAVSVRLAQRAKNVEGVMQWPYRAVAEALEVIPRTLVQNAGASPVRVLTDLRAKHAEGQTTWGINGDTGALADMRDYGVWEPQAIKLQSIKTAIESACLLLRVDDICSAKAAQQAGGAGAGGD